MSKKQSGKRNMGNSPKLNIPSSWEIREDEQIGARTSQAKLGQIELYSPIQGGNWITMGSVYQRLRKVGPESALVLDASCVDYLLSVEDQIPEDWKKFNSIDFWGTIFRENSDPASRPKILKMSWKSLLNRWDVGVVGLSGYDFRTKDLGGMSTTLNDDLKYRIPFLDLTKK